jgi:dienelactone hydrolase
MLGAVRSMLAGLVLAGLVAGGCAAFPVTFPNTTPGAPRTIPGWLSGPSGSGPFPALVLLHGCEGITGTTHGWARWLNERGYVTLVVDSWTPRGLAETCSIESPDVPSSERFDDALGAVRFLGSRPEVDAARIGAIGWSNGGVFAMSLVNGPTYERARRRGVTVPQPGVRAAVAVSPGGCYSLVEELAVRPLLVLIGDADDWTVPGPCVEMVNAMRGRGADVSIVLYPGAVHYFDVEGLPRSYLPRVANRNKPGGCCGATVGYDAAASADAHRRIADFFGYHLGAAGAPGSRRPSPGQ